jgi:hypothetical protein
MRKICNNHYAYASLSPLELNEMTGGFMMGLIMRFSAPALQQDGIRKSCRHGETILTEGAASMRTATLRRADGVNRWARRRAASRPSV